MAGELTTTNYGWTKPTVGASTDAWGGYLNADLDGIDSVVHGVQTSVPAASSSSPLMDGTAAVGAGTTWARADHIHPTDTSRAAVTALPPASTVTPLPDGNAAVGVSAAYARADHIHPAVQIGDNRIINGNFAVNQRAQVSGTALAAAAYGHDRWKAGASGCTYTFTATLPDTTITLTAGTLTQIIEAGMIEGGVYTLSWTGTAGARVYQGTPTGSYVASPITTASLPAGANTTVEFAAGTVTRVKLESGAIVTPFPRQSLAKSMADCQRYYQVCYQLIANGYAVGGANVNASFTPFTMRASPTIALSVPVYSNASGLQTYNININSFTLAATITATGSGYGWCNVILDAEL